MLTASKLFSLSIGCALITCGFRSLADSTGATVEPVYNQPWQITSYATDAGLTRQRVFDIAFTPDGTAWVAAEDGLRRFDGFRWERFGTNAELPSKFARAVMVSAKGELWVGSDAGAGVFDGQRLKYDPRGSQAGLANANVREIDEDPDGTLWFSCDQWPDSNTRPGGLTCLKNSQWRTFGRADGIPMDYVIGYFRDSTGRQFALTPHGWVQWHKGQWGPPVNPGFETEDCVLQMAEAGDGTLFAQGERQLLVLKGGRWQPQADNLARLVCATRDGQVVAMEYSGSQGRLWFSLWEGNRFVRASAPVSCQSNARFYHLREAPDGSLWCVGYGTVVRWAYRAGKWTVYPQLPPPVGADAAGRIWFAGESNVVVYANGRFQALPPGKLRALNPAGQAMIGNTDRNQLVVTDPRDPTVVKRVETGCVQIDNVRDAGEDGFWVCGQNGSGDGVVAHYRQGKTTIITLPEFRNRQLTAMVPESPRKLLVVAHHRDDSQYEVARVTDEPVECQLFRAEPPPLTYSALNVGAGRIWLCGYSGLFEQAVGAADGWQQVTAFPDGGFAASLANSNEVLFTFSGGRSGHPGCSLFSQNGWHVLPGDFSQPTFGPDQKTIYLSSHGGVFIRKEPGTLDFEYLQAPGDTFVNLTVAESDGTLWLGTSEGVLRYRPSHIPPATRITASATEVRQGAGLPVAFRGLTRFEKESSPANFRYAWRIDAGRWSPFEPWREGNFPLPALPPGSHRLEVRARDVDGNVSVTPAALTFTVLPVPLQQRIWFTPAVLLLAGLMAWLVWIGVDRTRQIARSNAALREAQAQLEHRVVERTAELTRANESLNREIAERKLAEEQQRRLEEQLHQSQKMEAIGTLAGGIAHDFNNILAVIIPYCHLIQEEVTDRPDLQEQLTLVLRAADRAKNLVQQILTFSRRQHHKRRLADLQPVLNDSLKLLRSVLPSTIQIIPHLNPVPPVLVDPTQVHQVILNLCVNAQHAMEGRQGRLEVGLDEVQADEALCTRSADLRPGRYVRLTVRDNGCGMAPDIQRRIFEPFFTTKDTGQGTGLGLAVVHGIVKNYDGAILVQSWPGKGSLFEVFLPAQTGDTDKITDAPHPVFQFHGEHILVVDDEAAITNVLKIVLSRIGCRVTAFTDPQAALEDFASRPQDFKLILSDLTMPGMTGLELAKKIYAFRPELAVVVTTGFGGDLISPAQLAGQPNIRKVIEKPLNPDTVVRVVAELLSNAPAPAPVRLGT